MADQFHGLFVQPEPVRDQLGIAANADHVAARFLVAVLRGAARQWISSNREAANSAVRWRTSVSSCRAYSLRWSWCA